MSHHERFSSSSLDHKLRDLTNSQHSIEALSLWVVKHRKHAKTAVEIWFKELCKAAPSRKLTLLFLSNDIVQNSRKKGTELNREFSKVMFKVLQISYKDEDLQLTQGTWVLHQIGNGTRTNNHPRLLSEDIGIYYDHIW